MEEKSNVPPLVTRKTDSGPSLADRRLSLAVGIFTLASMQRFFKQRLAQNMETELQQVHYLLQHTALGSIAERCIIRN
jgi:hypothetical protein